MTRTADVLARMQALPFAGVDAIAPGTSLILAPHPDDESLGCGGLIAALCAAGRPPLVVAVTDGAGSHPHSVRYPPARLAALRAEELRAATAILGLHSERVTFLGLPDTSAPSEGPKFMRAVAAIEAMARAQAVTTIFTTWRHDPHGDHQAVAAIGAAAASGARLRLYPVWGWLLPAEQDLPVEAVAGRRLDITGLLPLKRRAIAAHASQYSNLIADDPKAFRLPTDLLAVVDRPFEVFLQP
ncbi:MAG: PIG-L family deacetylase [Acetobacteraceae bacterium]|nr:PIG-L family deacetylase [Acetobacteraceae bacterium]